MRITSSLLSFYEWWYNCVQDSLVLRSRRRGVSSWEKFRARDIEGQTWETCSGRCGMLWTSDRPSLFFSVQPYPRREWDWLGG
jgi:hypothetical protein